MEKKQADRWGGRRAVAGAAVEAQADLSQSFSSLSVSVSVSLFSLIRRAIFFFFFLRNSGANEMLLECSGGEKEIKEGG